MPSMAVTAVENFMALTPLKAIVCLDFRLVRVWLCLFIWI